MITAKSATQELQKKHLDFISYLEREGDKQVKEALKMGVNWALIVINNAPGTDMMTKAQIGDFACHYYERLGYQTKLYSDKNKVELKWELY